MAELGQHEGREAADLHPHTTVVVAARHNKTGCGGGAELSAPARPDPTLIDTVEEREAGMGKHTEPALQDPEASPEAFRASKRRRTALEDGRRSVGAIRVDASEPREAYPPVTLALFYKEPGPAKPDTPPLPSTHVPASELDTRGAVNRTADKDAGTISAQRRPAYSFFSFPGEIRNAIYRLMLYPDSPSLYSAFDRQVEEFYSRRRKGYQEPFPKPQLTLRCPTVLQLCKTITAEVLPLLHSEPFVVSRLPPWIPGQPRPMLVSSFISRKTLQGLRRIELRITLGQGSMGSGWAWAGLIVDIFRILLQKNKLDELQLTVLLWNDCSAGIRREEARVLRRIMRFVSFAAS